MVKRIAFALVLGLAGCMNATMTCPSGKSSVTYKGVAFYGTSSVACLSSALGDTAQVSGLDLAALAAMVAPLVPSTPATATHTK